MPQLARIWQDYHLPITVVVVLLLGIVTLWGGYNMLAAVASNSPSVDVNPSTDPVNPSSPAQRKPPQDNKAGSPNKTGGGSKAGERKVLTIAGVEFAFRWCPPGKFMMGSPASEEGHVASDETQRLVTLTKGFWMLETEVTQEMYGTVMGDNPSYQKGKRLPVVCVTWDDCQAFITKLNTLHRESGFKFSLPTEAQWEYACRAGTTTPYHFGSVWDSSKANSDTTTVVGLYPANAWGLYNMHGNVNEWCCDWYDERPEDLYSGYKSDAETDPVGPSTGHYRMYRGGSWRGNARDCRSGYRGWEEPLRRPDSLGLRLSLVPDK